MAKYNIEFKQKVAKHYLKNGLSSTQKLYNVSNTAIYKWGIQLESEGFMRKKNENYSVEKKIEIIKYYRKHGKVETEKKYNISDSVFYKWERIWVEEGEEGLALERRGRGTSKKPKKDVNKDKDLLEENKRLRMENEYLKKLDALVREREEREKKKK